MEYLDAFFYVIEKNIVTRNKYKEFDFEEETDLEQVALIFYPIQVQRINYLW